MHPAAQGLELARVVWLGWRVIIMAVVGAPSAIGAGYPADYATMLRDLIGACKKGGVRRVDASSSHSVCRRVDERVGYAMRPNTGWT